MTKAVVICYILTGICEGDLSGAIFSSLVVVHRVTIVHDRVGFGVKGDENHEGPDGNK